MNWNDVRIFSSILRERSAKGAADALKIHHSTVTRRIEALETELKTKLFDRTPDGFVLTPIGETLSEFSREIEKAMIEAETKIAGRDQQIEGIVKITIAEPLAVSLLIPALPNFHEQYPEIDLRIDPTITFVDIARRDADIAVRLDNNPPAGLIGKRITTYTQTGYATPHYLETHDVNASATTARWLGWQADEQRYPDWTSDTGLGRVPVSGIYTSIPVQQAAARAGLGIALLPCLFGDADPELCRATDAKPIPSRDVWLLTHPDLRRTARVRAVMGFVEEILKQNKARIEGKA